MTIKKSSYFVGCLKRRKFNDFRRTWTGRVTWMPNWVERKGFWEWTWGSWSYDLGCSINYMVYMLYLQLCTLCRFPFVCPVLVHCSYAACVHAIALHDIIIISIIIGIGIGISNSIIIAALIIILRGFPPLCAHLILTHTHTHTHTY